MRRDRTLSPVFVLRDWEARDVAKYDKFLGEHPYSRAFICADRLTNPQLDESWVGIERYLTTDYLRSVIPARRIGLESGEPGARLTIKRPTLESFKGALASGVAGGADPGDYMKALATWLDDNVEAVIRTVPAAAFSRL